MAKCEAEPALLGPTILEYRRLVGCESTLIGVEGLVGLVSCTVFRLRRPLYPMSLAIFGELSVDHFLSFQRCSSFNAKLFLLAVVSHLPWTTTSVVEQ